MHRPSYRTLRLHTGGLFTAALLATCFVTLHAAVPSWTVVGNASRLRLYVGVASLPDGRVLMTGGNDSGSTLGSAEIFSPVTNTWAPTAPLSVARYVHAQSSLDDGRVLVAGGFVYPQNEVLDSVEIYDATANTWTPAAPLGGARYGARAVTLDDGRVLVAGGLGTSVWMTDGEVYDPATDTWTPTGALVAYEFLPVLVKLVDGRVLMAGGHGTSGSSNVAQIYDPATNNWTLVAYLNRHRAWGAGARLGDGRVILVGGRDTSSSSGYWTDAEVYDAVANTWTLTSGIPGNVGGEYPAAASRNDGQVLAVGGATGISFPNGAALFDPATNTWTATSPMSANPRVYGIAIPIPGNRTLVAGGVTTVSEVYGAPNSVPAADAGTDQTVSGCPSCLGLAVMDASGSSDADADVLTYTWKEGATILAVTTDPIKSTTLGLGLGVHTLTLVVTDGAGGAATDSVDVTVEDVTGVSSAELLACQADKAALESSLVDSLAVVEQHLRLEFRNPLFTIPGGSPEARLENLSSAIVSLNRGNKNALYNALGGNK